MKEEIKVYKETRLPDGTLIQTTRRRLIPELQHSPEGYVSDNYIEDSSIVYENIVTTRKGGSERYKCESLEHAMDHHERLVGDYRGSGTYLANDNPTRLDLIDTEDD